ncbi:MAG TPA: hypothetical protein VFQ54_07680, partial [Thermomicrobiales bacterium]|nr:hypothetical protein [Thermomicrobiales bacterium]
MTQNGMDDRPDQENEESGGAPLAPPDPTPSSMRSRPLFRPAPYPSPRANGEEPELSDRGRAYAESVERTPSEPLIPVAPITGLSEERTPPSRTELLGSRTSAVVATVLRNWPFAIPIALFAVAAMIVPTMTQIATTDDWGYSRSVEILVEDGHLTVFPVVAATAVGQILWGALFGEIFGLDLGVMRLSTVVAVAIGGMALFGLLRQLGVSRWRSSMGVSLYLFNPLSFILSFTFMTDPHFTSWMLVAMVFYAWGLRDEETRPWAIVVGSIAAGYAFWIRQQGALIPFAVILYLVVTRRLWFNWRSLRLAAQAALAPAVMLVGYYVWLKWFNDVTAVQQGFFDEMKSYGWSGAWRLTRNLTYIELAYLGIILVPILLAVVPVWRSRSRSGSRVSASTVTPAAGFRTPLGYWLFVAVSIVIAWGLFAFTWENRRMPYISQFVGAGGLGPPDVPGSRMRLIEWPDIYTIATVAAVAGAIVASLL